MSAVLRDVLNFASLSKKEEWEAVNLQEVLAQVQNDLELVISEKGATITYDELPTIQAIPAQMHQLFYNLVNNSLKFSKPGVPPSIRITTKQLNGELGVLHPDLDQAKTYRSFTVQDNGIGFHQEADRKIFEIFQRLHSRDAFPGTGIGLALCKKVVQNHKGKIWAESKQGEGATFSVVLPH